MFAHQVVAGLNRKEPKAREWVYKSYYQDVLRTVRVSTAGASDAEDLASDVFLKLYNHPGDFDSIRVSGSSSLVRPDLPAATI